MIEMEEGVEEVLAPTCASCVILAGVAALIVLGLLIWGAKNPVVWRPLSVVAVGAGVSFLVWGIMSAAMCEPPAIGSATSLIGAGSGMTVGGIMLFVISLCTKR